MVGDWIGLVVDTGDFKEFDLVGHVVRARDTVLVQSEFADTSEPVDALFFRDRCFASTRAFLNLAEERDPVPVKFVLDVDRGLYICEIGQFHYRARNGLLV